MDLYQLECVLAVVKHRSFTRAAEEINISQSSLSQHIAKLENELGIRLFERTTRSVYLSPAGHDFLNHAIKIMDEISLAKQTIQQYLSAERGSITIGCMPVGGIYNIPSLISSFQKEYLKVRIKFEEAQCLDLFNMLKNSEIDIAFVHRYQDDHTIKFKDLIYDELALATSSRHKFAKRNLINLGEACNEKFILPKSNTVLYLDIMKACQKAGFKPIVVYQCESVESMLGFVQEDVGVTLLSSKVINFYSHIYQGISNVRLTPFVPRALSLATTKETYLNPTVKIFENYAEKWIGSQSP